MLIKISALKCENNLEEIKACKSFARDRLNLTVDPCFKVNFGHHTKNPLIFAFIFILELQNLKTSSKKSWTLNLWQVSIFTFNPCFKVMWDHHTKTAFYLKYYWSKGFEI